MRSMRASARLVAVRRETAALASALGVLVAGGAGAAGAAETVGSDLTNPPAISISNVDVIGAQTTAPAGAPFPISASQRGVITSLRLRHGASGASPGEFAFRVLAGTAPNFAARSHPRLPNAPIPPNAPAGLLSIVPRDSTGRPQGVPIAAGERVGVGQVNFPDSANMVSTLRIASGGAAFHYRFAPLPDAVDGTQTYSSVSGYEITLQYTVEPDSDNDGYGDESQDGCFDIAQPTILGSSASEIIVGTPGSDVIGSLGGDDVILGLGGDDIICGGDGNDIVKGGAGADTLYGEAGADKLRGGGQKDTCNGGPQRDTAKKCEKAKQL